MRTLIVIIVLASLSYGCASSTGVPCYAEVGIGGWVKKHGLVEENGLYGQTPSTFDLYCTKEGAMFGGDVTVGWYHTSDIGRGYPFNDQHEYVDEKIMVKYRKQIN